MHRTPLSTFWNCYGPTGQVPKLITGHFSVSMRHTHDFFNPGSVNDPSGFGASVKASADDLLSFSTWNPWLHLKSNNHLYLRWHLSEVANNLVNIGDECSQHWAAVLARKKSMRAKFFQLVSIEPKGGKVSCPQLEWSNNHSGLRLAIRSNGVFLFY